MARADRDEGRQGRCGALASTEGGVPPGPWRSGPSTEAHALRNGWGWPGRRFPSPHNLPLALPPRAGCMSSCHAAQPSLSEKPRHTPQGFSERDGEKVGFSTDIYSESEVGVGVSCGTLHSVLLGFLPRTCDTAPWIHKEATPPHRQHTPWPRPHPLTHALLTTGGAHRPRRLQGGAHALAAADLRGQGERAGGVAALA